MFTYISNQTTMNPTGDKLTSELQQTVHIEQPVVVGEGEKTTIRDKVASGVEKTGQKLEEGLETIASGVEFTGEKLKATGEFIGEKLGETLAATSEKLEHTIQKAADVVAEEKIELPGVVTFFQTGAARILGHLTGSATQTSSFVKSTAPTSPILPGLKPERNETTEIVTIGRNETTVYAEENLSGDIITTDITTGYREKPASRVDVMKQTGQLGPQSELHLPNLKVRDLPINRAIEEQPVYPEPQLPSLGQKEVQDGGQFIDVVEQKTTEAVQAEAIPSFVYIHPDTTQSDEIVDNLQPRTDQLPSLTSKAVLDGVVFMETAEHQLGNVQRKEQLPNLTVQAVHDGVAFIDQAEHQKFPKGTVNQMDLQLPSLSTKDVHDGTRFLDVVENSM